MAGRRHVAERCAEGIPAAKAASPTIQKGAVAQLTDQVSYSDSSFLLHKNMKTLASSTPARVLVV